MLDFLIHRQNIQTNRTSLKILDAVLSVNLFDSQIITFQDDLQKELGTGAIFKNCGHEIVIDQTQSTQSLQIFFVFPFKIQFLL